MAPPTTELPVGEEQPLSPRRSHRSPGTRCPHPALQGPGAARPWHCHRHQERGHHGATHRALHQGLHQHGCMQDGWLGTAFFCTIPMSPSSLMHPCVLSAQRAPSLGTRLERLLHAWVGGSTCAPRIGRDKTQNEARGRVAPSW